MESLDTVISRTVIASIANCAATTLAGSVRAVFELAYQDALGIANGAPTLQAASADVDSLAAGDAVQVLPDGATAATGYTVREVQPDGRGITRLLLEAA